MEVGFFFWPYDVELVRRMAAATDRYGYDMIGIADTPGNAMDPWVASTLAAEACSRTRIALCVTNLVTRQPAVSAASIASLDMLAPGRCVLGLGAGHSGTTNLGMPRSGLADTEAGIRQIKTLLSGEPATLDGGTAHIPWVTGAPKVFLAGSGPKTLALAGAVADGTFVNYGITADTIAQSEARVRDGAIAAGRDPDAVENWQIASLDCNADGDVARKKAGAILAFMAGGYILQTKDLSTRGVPEHLHEPVLELRRRYSTRPGDADAALVDELGLFDYLAGRFAIYGTPDQCLEQLLAAHAAGLKRVMFTVSVASDPAGTVELFGEKVLPRFRAAIADGR
jgi:5,10-methylenetetrahydromethanopterin reductase